MKTFIGAVLLLSTSVFAQTVFFSDDFESGSLSNWGTQKNDPGQSYTIVDDGSGNNVAQMVHTKSQGRALLGNSLYSGFSELQCVVTFDVSLADNTTGAAEADFIIATDNFSAGPKQIAKVELDKIIPSADTMYGIRVVLNNDSSSLTYDGSETVAPNTLDIWRDGVLVVNDQAISIAGNAGVDAQSFGFVINKNENNNTVTLDNFEITGFASGPAQLNVSATSLDFELLHPEQATNASFNVSYIAGGSGNGINIENIIVNNSSHPSAFSLQSITYPLAIASFPSTTAIEVTYDAAAAGITNGVSTNALGSLDIVWSEIGSGISQTNVVNLDGRYRNPAVNLTLTPGYINDALEASATTYTKTLQLAYTEGPAHTNVVISSIALTDQTEEGFAVNTAWTVPYTMLDQSPSNITYDITYDNTVGGLTDGQSATGALEIVWYEIGGLNQTSSVPFTIGYINPPAGPFQENFNNDIIVNGNVLSSGTPNGDFSLQILNDYANLTNGWRTSSGLNLDENGYVQQNSSAANSRAAFKLIKYGTVGEDNIGDLNTTALVSGQYAIQLDYAVNNAVNAQSGWHLSAYALRNQQDYDADANNDYISYDHGEGSAIALNPSANGAAEVIFDQSSGRISGNTDVDRTTGTLTINIDEGDDLLFAVNGYGEADVRLHSVFIYRVGDYQAPVSPTNAVVDATFGVSSTNNAFYRSFTYDLNGVADTNGVVTTLPLTNRWVHSQGPSGAEAGVWNNNALANMSGWVNSRSTTLHVRHGVSGYDDVGDLDTIALSSGYHDLFMNIEFDATVSNGYGRISVYGVSGMDGSGNLNVNDVRLSLGNSTNDIGNTMSHEEFTDAALPKVRGAVSTNLLANVDYSSDFTGQLLFEGLSVEANEDLLIVINSHLGADFKVIDNVQLLRTGDLPLTGYELWASTNSITGTPSEDDDGDGLSNLAEFVMGRNPNSDADSRKLMMHQVGGNMSLVVPVRKSLPADVSYRFQTNSDLVFGEWQDVQYTNMGTNSTDVVIHTITNQVPTDETKQFIRMLIDKN
tara:strand:- start:602 stop:3715 length:3114 start_codon:yes stop_codon:yes gene_type:complete